MKNFRIARWLWRGASAFVLTILLPACQSAGETGPVAPAVLVSADAATMAKVKAVLADAVGRATIELGPEDPTQSSTLSVLPPRPSSLEDRSLAAPVQFDLMIQDGNCYAVRRATSAMLRLDGVSCRLASE